MWWLFSITMQSHRSECRTFWSTIDQSFVESASATNARYRDHKTISRPCETVSRCRYRCPGWNSWNPFRWVAPRPCIAVWQQSAPVASLQWTAIVRCLFWAACTLTYNLWTNNTSWLGHQWYDINQIYLGVLVNVTNWYTSWWLWRLTSWAHCVVMSDSHISFRRPWTMIKEREQRFLYCGKHIKLWIKG